MQIGIYFEDNIHDPMIQMFQKSERVARRISHPLWFGRQRAVLINSIDMMQSCQQAPPFFILILILGEYPLLEFPTG